MRVLVACEFSGIVREAFRRMGHDAWSCDLESVPCADCGGTGNFYGNDEDGDYLHCDGCEGRGFQGNHIEGDVRNHLNEGWDLVIAHPPCTHLAVSGARWWKDRQREQREAAEFFMEFTKMECKWAIENPIGAMSRLYRKPDQIIQPWMFGHGETKATCLWLKGLPLLKPSNVVDGRIPRIHHESPGIKNGLTRAQRRSITFQGIAD